MNGIEGFNQYPCINLHLGLTIGILASWSVMLRLPLESNDAPTFAAQVIIVLGNQCMYFLSQAVAYRVGFHARDTAESFYTALYTLAVR